MDPHQNASAKLRSLANEYKLAMDALEKQKWTTFALTKATFFKSQAAALVEMYAPKGSTYITQLQQLLEIKFTDSTATQAVIVQLHALLESLSRQYATKQIPTPQQAGVQGTANAHSWGSWVALRVMPCRPTSWATVLTLFPGVARG